MRPNDIPTYPNRAARSINGNRRIRTAELISFDGTRKDEIAVKATTIIIVETSPAFTIASPITKPPTIPIVCPTRLGKRIPASQ